MPNMMPHDVGYPFGVLGSAVPDSLRMAVYAQGVGGDLAGTSDPRYPEAYPQIGGVV